MSLFKFFPTVDYPIQEDSIQKVVDIFRQVRPVSYLIDDTNVYQLYNIQDGERPDVVSFKLYDTVDYYWTFFIINEQLRSGLQLWPKSLSELQDYTDRKYPGNVLAGYRTAGATADQTNILNLNFSVGETIRGETSGVTAVIESIDANLNQAVLTNENGAFLNNEDIIGENDQVLLQGTDYYFKVIPYIDAPRYYVDENGNPADFIEPVERPSRISVTNRVHEEEVNDNLSAIRVIKKEFIEDFAIAYRNLVNL